MTERQGTVTERTVTTGPSGETLVERALSSGGFVLARLAAVALAAFLAGAVVQRLFLAQFAIKIGPVELGELSDTTREGLAAVRQRLESQMTAVAEVNERLAREEARTKELADATADALLQLERRVSRR